MNKEIIQEWLVSDGRKHGWLAEQLDESKQTVSSFMRENNPRPIPARLIEKIQSVMNNHTKNNIVSINEIKLRPTTPQRESWEDAGLITDGEATAFTYDRLDALARGINQSTTYSGLVAEDPIKYGRDPEEEEPVL